MAFSKHDPTLRFLCTVTGRTAGSILVLTLLQVLLGASSIVYALLLKRIINTAVAGERELFFLAIAELVGLMAGQQLLRAVCRWLDELTRSTLENRFRSRLFAVLLNKDFSSVSRIHSGEWSNRLTSDTAVVANGLTNILPGLSGMAVKLVGAVIVILALEPRFCYLVIPGGILLLLFSTLFRRRIKALHKRVQEKDGILRSLLQDILGSMLVIRSFAIEPEAVQAADQKMADHKAMRMQKNRFSNLCNTGFGFVMNGAYVIGASFCGYGILTGTMDYGNFMAVLQLIGQVQSPFANISSYLPQWYALLASAERLMEAEHYTDQSSAAAMPPAEIRERYRTELLAFGLEKACFTYQPPVQSTDSEAEPPMPVVLHDVTLCIPKGSYTAFTGQSGCGKSTVMKLLLSLYTLDSGEKYVRTTDGREPLDVRWQRLFAYVPQGNHLMSGTIREIITLPDRTKMQDEAAIREALRIACAEEFVDGLENGIDTALGERGQGLSEGQMQRIAVARAVFSGAPVLLLDESTSALDMQTEERLLHNLKTMTDKTVVIVTHRPAALAICDTIIDFTEHGCEVHHGSTLL